MPSIVKLSLRTVDDGSLRYVDIDLDQLSPRARALAEAVAQRDLCTRGPIWCVSRATVRDLVADAESWYSTEALNRPHARVWDAWSPYDDQHSLTETEYLEQQARRIPAEYSIVGSSPGSPVPSATAAHEDTGMTRAEVLAYLARHGRRIEPGTWSSYVARGQAPAPVRRVGRTPLWALEDISQWLAERQA